MKVSNLGTVFTRSWDNMYLLVSVIYVISLCFSQLIIWICDGFSNKDVGIKQL